MCSITDQMPYKNFWQRPVCWTLQILQKEEAKCTLIEEILDVEEDGGSGAGASAAVQQQSWAQTAMPPAAKRKTLGDLLKPQTDL